MSPAQAFFNEFAETIPRRGLAGGVAQAADPRITVKPSLVVHDDYVNCDFTAAEPNRRWLSDITEHPMKQGKFYLCAIKDLWSNQIVGCAIDSYMRVSLAV